MNEDNDNIITPGFAGNPDVHQHLVNELHRAAAEMGLQFRLDTNGTQGVALDGFAFPAITLLPNQPMWMVRLRVAVDEVFHGRDMMAIRPENCILQFDADTFFNVSGQGGDFETQQEFDPTRQLNGRLNSFTTPDWSKWIQDVEASLQAQVMRRQIIEKTERLAQDLRACAGVAQTANDSTVMEVDETSDYGNNSTLPKIKVAIETNDEDLLVAIATLVREHHIKKGLAASVTEFAPER